MTEAVCWNAIAADGYKLRWYQEPIYYCEYLEDGLTKTGANDLSGHIANFQGYCFYIRQCPAIKHRLDSYRDFVEFEKPVMPWDLAITSERKRTALEQASYLWNKKLIMPLVHNYKRVVFVFKKARAFVSR